MADLRVPIGLRAAWRDKWLLGMAFLLLWCARIEVSVKGVGDPRKACGRTAGLPVPSPALSTRVAWSVDRASRLVIRPTCLVRALAGQRLLAMKGCGSRILVGVSNSGGNGFEAHAWLSVGGKVLLGNSSGEVSRFRPLIGPAE